MRNISDIRNTLWTQIFALPKDSGLPLQLQLRSMVVQAILGGRLAPGAALPSSRDLAAMLVLSRNTVSASYQQLVDEGFLEARPRHGIFVSRCAIRRRADCAPDAPVALAHAALAELGTHAVQARSLAPLSLSLHLRDS